MDRKPTVLVVEDDEAIRELVAESLSDEGFQVVEASNGLEGVAFLRRLQPDLILLDMAMPILDGKTFLKLCRRLFKIRVPIVIMSAHMTNAKNLAGIAAFLRKPFDLPQLINTVQATLKAYHSEPLSKAAL